MTFGWFGSTPSKAVIQKILKDSGTVGVIHEEDTTLFTKLQKEPVQVVAYYPVLFEGLQIIDGYQTKVGDRILVAGQGDDSQNGIYIASEGIWSRSEDCNSSENVIPKMVVAVHYGKRYEDTTWQLDIDTKDITVGTTSLIWRIESFDEMNGRTFPIVKDSWYSENDKMYISIEHYMNTLFPNTTIYEQDEFSGEYSRVKVDRIIIVDSDHLKLEVPIIDDIDMTFNGYILIEPDR